MGIITSRDTRRISFDNTFASSNALAVPKAMGSEDILCFDDVTQETATDLIFAEKTKCVEILGEGEADYWTQRIENLKKEHQFINSIFETEYDKQIKITNKGYEPPKVITHERLLKIKPCFDWRSKIMQCYEDNPRQPLVCSPYVQAFTKCVTTCRTTD